MKLIYNRTRRLLIVPVLLPVVLLLTLVSAPAAARGQEVSPKTCEAKAPSAEVNQTFFLRYVTQPKDLNDIQTDLRNMIPRLKVFGVSTKNALTVHGTPDDVAAAQKMIAELDKPRKTYRLTFTITQFDGPKRTGSQSYTLIAANGRRTTFKQGSRVPIVTGSFDNDSGKTNTQVQYQDVGLMIDSTAESLEDGLSLNSRIEQTSLAEEKSGVGQQDPVLRQTAIDAASSLTFGKPLVLGSLDTPGSTQKQEVSVEAELVR
jgi:type II secretory pathway component GspD/PulD (secretin)